MGEKILEEHKEEKSMEKQFRCEACDRTFKDIDGLTAHNKAKHPEKVPKEKKPLPVKKIRNWAIFIVIVGLIIWGIIGLANQNSAEKTIIDESNLTFDVPNSPFHWHPHLTIMIDGKKETIPANIGISQGIMTMHTHEAGGTIHMEPSSPTKQTVVLGYFFQVWGKRLSKDCIFDFCNDKGTLKMSVNGKENFEFENYFMQDGDQIIIEYTSNEN